VVPAAGVGVFAGVWAGAADGVGEGVALLAGDGV
jgi:hypothetical protein